jgi:hypothetical protein
LKSSSTNGRPFDETHGIQHRGFKHLPLRIRCKVIISFVSSINHQTISLRNGSEKRQERRKVPGAMLECLSDCRYGASRIFTLSHGQRNGQDHSTMEIHTSSFMLVVFVLRPCKWLIKDVISFEFIDFQENTRCKIVLI